MYDPHVTAIFQILTAKLSVRGGGRCEEANEKHLTVGSRKELNNSEEANRKPQCLEYGKISLQFHFGTRVRCFPHFRDLFKLLFHPERKLRSKLQFTVRIFSLHQRPCVRLWVNDELDAQLRYIIRLLL